MKFTEHIYHIDEPAHPLSPKQRRALENALASRLNFPEPSVMLFISTPRLTGISCIDKIYGRHDTVVGDCTS